MARSRHGETSHEYSVYSVAWSPDGKQIASGSFDNTIKIWDAQSGDCQSTLTGHLGWYFFFSSYFFLKFLPLLLLIRFLTSHNFRVLSVAWSPDGKQIASGSREGDGTIKIWDSQSGDCQSTLTGHSDVYVSFWNKLEKKYSKSYVPFCMSVRQTTRKDGFLLINTCSKMISM